jgi:hypothetical protein
VEVLFLGSVVKLALMFVLATMIVGMTSLEIGQEPERSQKNQLKPKLPIKKGLKLSFFCTPLMIIRSKLGSYKCESNSLLL